MHRRDLVFCNTCPNPAPQMTGHRSAASQPASVHGYRESCQPFFAALSTKSCRYQELSTCRYCYEVLIPKAQAKRQSGHVLASSILLDALSQLWAFRPGFFCLAKHGGGDERKVPTPRSCWRVNTKYNAVGIDGGLGIAAAIIYNTRGRISRIPPTLKPFAVAIMALIRCE